MDESVDLAIGQQHPIPGSRLGSQYVVGERLGRGAMGVVHAASAIDGRQLAVKFLRPELASDDKIVARFLQERAIFRKIRHINVVDVVDLVAEGDVLAIVMERVTGGDLRQRINEGTINPQQALRLCIGVATGLAAIHGGGVVHRDLKPANILLSEDLLPKISDFGISRLAQDRSATTGTRMGTPRYMAPESADHRGAQEPADVYALGAILFEMLVGQPPFTVEGAIPMINAHTHNTPPRVGGVPDSVADLVDWMLSKDPDVRPSAEAVLRELRSAMPLMSPDMEPVPEHRPGPDDAALGPAGATLEVPDPPETVEVLAPNPFATQSGEFTSGEIRSGDFSSGDFSGQSGDFGSGESSEQSNEFASGDFTERSGEFAAPPLAGGPTLLGGAGGVPASGQGQHRPLLVPQRRQPSTDLPSWLVPVAIGFLIAFIGGIAFATFRARQDSSGSGGSDVDQIEAGAPDGPSASEGDGDASSEADPNNSAADDGSDNDDGSNGGDSGDGSSGDDNGAVQPVVDSDADAAGNLGESTTTTSSTTSTVASTPSTTSTTAKPSTTVTSKPTTVSTTSTTRRTTTTSPPSSTTPTTKATTSTTKATTSTTKAPITTSSTTSTTRVTTSTTEKPADPDPVELEWVSGPTVIATGPKSFRFAAKTSDACGAGRVSLFEVETDKRVGYYSQSASSCAGPWYRGHVGVDDAFSDFEISPLTDYRVVITVVGTPAKGDRPEGEGRVTETLKFSTPDD